jgi:hypothetical protein
MMLFLFIRSFIMEKFASMQILVRPSGLPPHGCRKRKQRMKSLQPTDVTEILFLITCVWI